MKSNILHKLLMVAMVAAVAITFTACGGDDAEESTPPLEPEKDNTYIYVEPYMVWGSLRTDVKAYMSTSGWNLDTDAAYLVYRNADRTIEQEYAFYANATINETEGLLSVRVKYKNYTEEYWQWFVKETEKRYGVTFTIEETDATTGGDSVTTVINGNQVTIAVMKYAGEMYIAFILK